MAIREWIGKIVQAEAAKTSAAGPVVAWSSIGRPRWTPRRYDALSDEGFRKNVVAYRCVSLLSHAVGAIPFLLYGAAGEEMDRHPLLRLLTHPNPGQDGTVLRENMVAHILLAGNAYVEAVQPGDDAPPQELYVLRPDRMRVVPGAAGLPLAYEYSVGERTARWPADPLTGASNILHLKSFHPLDDWYGMAPLEAALMAVDQHNAASAWNQAMLNNAARPSGALVFAPREGPATLSDEQVRRLKEELNEHYQSARNAGRPLILEGGLEWQTMSLSPVDMDWLAGRDAAARDIALAFGVPAQLVGIPDAQSYANMQEARLALYEETVLPLAERLVGALNHWLAPMFGDGLRLAIDRDEIAALTLRRDTLWDKLQGVSFLTVNEKRHAVGYAPLPGGDRLEDAPPRKKKGNP
ncbi:MAG: phage portal protein [Alphaproteobacteria bacterium]|nr:phage portal protein [Alphaproteobacteria bacterium]